MPDTVPEMVKLFSDAEAHYRDGYGTLLAGFPERKCTVGKHEAKNWIHLERVLSGADNDCPRAADTIRWLLLHNVLDAQWYLHVAEMLPSTPHSKEASE